MNVDEKTEQLGLLTEMEEIWERFDKIKDHKPKATKKLKELGFLISSAYMQDLEVADEMWEYLVNLNIIEYEEKTVTFYLISVWNKIKEALGLYDATVFMCRSKKRHRLYLQVREGKLGRKIVEEMLVPYFICNDFGNLRNMFLFVTNDLIDRDSELCEEVCANICHEYIVEGKVMGDVLCDEDIEGRKVFIQWAAEQVPEKSKKIIQFAQYIKGDVKSILDIESWLEAFLRWIEVGRYGYLALKHIFELWDMPECNLGQTELEQYYLKIMEICQKRNFYYPDYEQFHKSHEMKIETNVSVIVNINGQEYTVNNYNNREKSPLVTDTEAYRESTLCRVLETILNSESILEHYFTSSGAAKIKRNIVYAWIISNDWASLKKYLTMDVKRIAMDSQSCIENFESYMDTFIDGINLWKKSGKKNMIAINRTDRDDYGRDWFIIDETRIAPFLKVLEYICDSIVGTDSYSYFSELCGNDV